MRSNMISQNYTASSFETHQRTSWLHPLSMPPTFPSHILPDTCDEDKLRINVLVSDQPMSSWCIQRLTYLYVQARWVMSQAFDKIVGADFSFSVQFIEPHKEGKGKSHLRLGDGGRKETGLQQLSWTGVRCAFTKMNTSAVNTVWVYNVEQNIGGVGARIAITTKEKWWFITKGRHGSVFR